MTQSFARSDRKLAGIMSDYWVNFAKTGNPNGRGLPLWPEFNLETEPYLELGDAIKPGTRVLQEECDFFERFCADQRSHK